MSKADIMLLTVNGKKPYGFTVYYEDEDGNTGGIGLTREAIESQPDQESLQNLFDMMLEVKSNV